MTLKWRIYYGISSMQRLPFYENPPIHFAFNASREDFIVREISSHTWSQSGSYLILELERTNLSTWEVAQELQDALGLSASQVSYAGLKDKQATSTQYFAVPLRVAKAVEKFTHPHMRILSTARHNEKLSLGDIAANSFDLTLHYVKPIDAPRIESMVQILRQQGFANYFGYQRFGVQGGNFEQAKAAAHDEEHVEDTKLHRLLVSAYQSELFNRWLAKRVILSRGAAESMTNAPLTLLEGDVLYNYTTQKWENVTDVTTMRKALKEQKVAITGLLAGAKAWRAKGAAGAIEAQFDDDVVMAKGDRRIAWVYPKKVRTHYDADKETMQLSFELPKSVYATVFLEAIAGRDLTPKPREKRS